MYLSNFGCLKFVLTAVCRLIKELMAQKLDIHKPIAFDKPTDCVDIQWQWQITSKEDKLTPGK